MKKPSAKKASLIIACRNEREAISACLDSVLAQDYPANLIEIFVIDGESDDGTKEILTEYARGNTNIKVINNPKRIQPYAFNMGIKKAKGDYIFIMGAHSKYPSNYVSKCLRYAEKYGVDNVGGRIVAKAKDNKLISRAIIGTYTSPFGIGNATFRKDTGKPVLVDTVFGGCYRREVFQRIGGYNEALKRSQDMELNLRLVRSGGRILLVPSIITEYFPKTKLGEFITYSFRSGKGPIRAMHITKKPLKLMHYVPVFFTAGLLAGLILSLFPSLELLILTYISVLTFYLALAIFFSISYAKNKKDPLMVIVLPPLFLIKHFFYGLGSIYGAFKIND